MDNPQQLAARDVLYKALTRAFTGSEIDWAGCTVEDRGDGALILVPPQVPKAWLASRLAPRVALMVGRYSAACPAGARLRVRMALHAGEIHQDPYGVAGHAINHAFRLIEEPTVKATLGISSAAMVLVVSEWFYQEVVRHHIASVPSSFQLSPASGMGPVVRHDLGTT